MIQIYNSLHKAKQPLTPIEPNHVKIYCCGITVYDYSHIGHARGLIVFDAITRYLRYRGYQVTLVRNITDIDDKIIQRALERGQAWDELAQQFITALHQDEKALQLTALDHEPRATQYIPQMIALIERLIAKEQAYVASNGDVYFDVRRFSAYGKLSHRDIAQLQSGIRIDVNDAKRAPLDFVLWKMSKPGEPFWPSPWGNGRPGWHIECSAMSTELLGQPFDIHGGGMDLKFPHHENEIAQSEAAHDCDFANIWMHIGLLQINNEKMSKSLGNFLTIRDALARYPAEVLRYFMISGHYRSPVNYADETLAHIQQSVQSLYIALRDLPTAEVPEAHPFEQRFIAAMDDDFNTPEALAVLFEIAHEINRLRPLDIDQAAQLGALLVALGKPLGLLQQSAQQFLHGGADGEFVTNVEQLIAQRQQARHNRQWQEADRIRDQLSALGVAIEDGADGTSWRKL